VRGPDVAFTLKWADHSLDLDSRTYVMGVLNVTPDSFSEEGRFFDFHKAVEHGEFMARAGADLIDIGGESTRPYSRRISAQEEMDRVLPVVEALSKRIHIPLSIDTTKAAVADKAIKAGASIINDISALRFDAAMAGVAARAGCPVVLMHMQGTPEDMQDHPHYDDVVRDVIHFLRDAKDRAVAAGIRKDLVLVDPGIGFGKTFNGNLALIRRLSEFRVLGCPLLIGTSNKAFIGKILGRETHERGVGTMATVAAAVMNGAHVVRVHDVGPAVETARVIDAIRKGRIEGSEEV
jgi:dihydropteroate synthase